MQSDEGRMWPGSGITEPEEGSFPGAERKMRAGHPAMADSEAWPARSPVPATSGASLAGYAAQAQGADATSEATQWLGGAGRPDGTTGIYWLERRAGTRVEPLSFEGTTMRIGRAGESVQIVDRSPGVSRIHLELTHANGEVSAKDMGSRNGSTLNGEAMIPYKTYKLQEGDLLQLAGTGGPVYELKRS
jgi:pSer/pThr/pTyr-binding forkhead associated (FHA) protein